MITTTNTIKCNHFFCILNGKKYPATYCVEQTFANGYVKITNCCESDFQAFSEVIKNPDGECTYVVTKI